MAVQSIIKNTFHFIICATLMLGATSMFGQDIIKKNSAHQIRWLLDL